MVAPASRESLHTTTCTRIATLTMFAKLSLFCVNEVLGLQTLSIVDLPLTFTWSAVTTQTIVFSA